MHPVQMVFFSNYHISGLNLASLTYVQETGIQYVSELCQLMHHRKVNLWFFQEALLELLLTLTQMFEVLFRSFYGNTSKIPSEMLRWSDFYFNCVSSQYGKVQNLLFFSEMPLGIPSEIFAEIYSVVFLLGLLQVLQMAFNQGLLKNILQGFL